MMRSTLDLDPPQGFEPADGFDGFVRPIDRASIVLRELPAPVAELTAGFKDPERTAKEGLELLGAEAIDVDGRPGRLFLFARGGEGDPWLQWTLALGDAEHTALVSATVPAASAKRDEAGIRAALGSLRWRAVEGDPFAGLGFQVEVGELVQQRRVGEMVLLGERDSFADPGGAVAVGRSTSDGMCIVNRERFAIQRLHREVVRVLDRRSHGPIEVAGLSGYRTVAEVESLQDADEDQRRLAAQVVLFPESDYFVFWVETDPEDTATLERFDALVGSFVRLDAQEKPTRDPVAPPEDAATILDQAFALAVRHSDDDARALAERLVRKFQGLDVRWAGAYAAEALFLRRSVEMLAPTFDGPPGTPFHLGTALLERYPGYGESTYERAMAYATELAG